MRPATQAKDLEASIDSGPASSMQLSSETIPVYVARYSPDLNPIEQAFARPSTRWRASAPVRTASTSGTPSVIARALHTQECAN